MNRARLIRTHLTVCLLALATSACHEWRAVDPARIARTSGAVRVETRSGEHVTLRSARVRGDTLVQEGSACPEQARFDRKEVRAWCAGIAVALDDVVRAEIGVESRTRTWLALGFFGLLWASLMLGLLELAPNRVELGAERRSPPAGGRAPRRA